MLTVRHQYDSHYSVFIVRRTNVTVTARLPLQHFLSGLHFVHTSSVVLPAAGLLPTSKGFDSKIFTGGGRSAFQHSTTFHKAVHPTSMEWFTIETGSRHLYMTQFSSFLFTLSYPLCIVLSRAGSPQPTMADCQSGWPSLLLQAFFCLCLTSLPYPTPAES